MSFLSSILLYFSNHDFILILPFILSLSCILISDKIYNYFGAICLLFYLSICFFLKNELVQFPKSTHFISVGGWNRQFGIELAINFNSFLVFLGCYCVVYFSHILFNVYSGFQSTSSVKLLILVRSKMRYHKIFTSTLLFGVYGLCMTNDLFNTYVWIEVVFLSLVGLFFLSIRFMEYGQIIIYIVCSVIASSLILLGIGIIYSITGLFNFTLLAEYIANGGINGKASIASIGSASIGSSSVGTSIESLYIGGGGGAGNFSFTLLFSGITFILLGFLIKVCIFPYSYWFQRLYLFIHRRTFLVINSISSKIHLYALYKILSSLFFANTFSESGYMTYVFYLLTALCVVTIIFSTILLNLVNSNDIKRAFIHVSVFHSAFAMLGVFYSSFDKISMYIFQYLLVYLFSFFFVVKFSSMINRIMSKKSLLRSLSAVFLKICRVLSYVHLVGLPLSGTFFVKFDILNDIIHCNSVLYSNGTFAEQNFIWNIAICVIVLVCNIFCIMPLSRIFRFLQK